MTVRDCYDSTVATDIPKTARLALAYLDGRFGNLRAIRAWLGPKARIVTITVLGDLTATMCDCEAGDLTPQSAAKWAADKRAAKRGFPTIYCLDSQHAEVIAACKARGLTLGKHYLLFVADYDGARIIPAYAVGKQFADPKLTGHHFDKSAVRAYWRGVDPVIRRVLAPLPPKPIVLPPAKKPVAPKPAPVVTAPPAPVTPIVAPAVPTAAPPVVPQPTPTQGENVKTLTRLARAGATWVKTHPAKVKHEIAVFVAALASQPVVHTFLNGRAAAGVIAVVTAAALAAARQIVKA